MSSNIGVFNSETANIIGSGIWGESTVNRGFIADKFNVDTMVNSTRGTIDVLEMKDDKLGTGESAAMEEAQTIYSRYKAGEAYEVVNFKKKIAYDPDEVDGLPLNKKLNYRNKQISFVTRYVKMMFESYIAGKVFNASTWGSTALSNAFASGSSNPAKELEAIAYARETAGCLVTDLVIGRAAYKDLVHNATLQAGLSDAERSKLDMNRIIDLLRVGSLEGLERIHVPRVTVNTADKNATASRSAVWTNNLIWMGQLDTGSFSGGTDGAFVMPYVNAAKKDFSIRLVRDEKIDEDAFWIEGSIKKGFGLVDADKGIIITGAV